MLSHAWLELERAVSLIYKIVPRHLWDAIEHAGTFAGASVDLSDGFIHFSTAAQVEGTAAKHFAGQRDLVLIAVDATCLGPALRWEVSRGGALFPHLYGTLETKHVVWGRPLPDEQNGQRDLSGMLV